jgi:uncharacterized coiled-coil DUF342 family protein
MTLRQLYQLTNNIRDALQDSNQIGVVVEAIQHFNKQLNAHKENPNAQKNDIVKFIARTQALAAHVNQNNIADNVIKSKSLRDQFEKKLTANLNLMPKIELYKKSEGKGLVGKPIVSILKGSLLMTLSQLQHDPDITASPNEKKKTKKALKALENRLTETSNLLQDICPRLKELHATFPKDQAAIEKIHTAVVDLLLTTPRKHQDAFDSRKIHETLNNAILEAGKSEISPKLREALTEMKAKYDTQFQSKPQKPKAAAEVSAAPEEAAPTTPAMRR